MATPNSTSGAHVAARDHNLQVLNPHRQHPTLAPSLTAVERERGLRFIAQTEEASMPTQLREAIRHQHQLMVEVQPLFPNVDTTADTNGMDRFFLVTLPGLAQRDVSDDVFDIAYMIADTPGMHVVSVEPDLPHAVFHGTPETALVGDLNPCQVDVEPPGDRAWHLRTMRVPEAWALEPPPGGQRFGRGSVVGHIDTGWAEHDDFTQENIRLERGHDFVDDDDDPHDPLEAGSFLGGPASPGHGTATSSVIVGRGDGGELLPDPAEREMWGVAPAAALLPIRAIRFVFFVFDGDVARAIQYAADQGCHVISMSLGGIPTAALEAAVNYAVARNVIVCAAAGNCLPSVVVGPAIYPNCIAVAGCTIDRGPWPFSSHGAKVAVTAPAENVWASRRSPDNASTSARTAGQGTSFAVAGVAGVAALWLAFHGRERLLERYRGHAYLHHVFRHLLTTTARASDLLPAGQFGSGIVDAHALLSAPLPDPTLVGGPARVSGLAVLAPADVIAAMYDDADPGAVQAQLSSLLGDEPHTAVGVAEGGPQRQHAWGAEITHILAQDPAAYARFGANLEVLHANRMAPAAVAPRDIDLQVGNDLGRLASSRLRSALTVAQRR